MHLGRTLALALLAAPAAQSAPIYCPAAITTPLAPESMRGWHVTARPSPTGFPFRGPDRAGAHRLERISVLDGPPEDVLADAPATLRPDSGADGPLRPPHLMQRWDLSAGSPRGLLLVCHYSNTATILAAVLPPGIRACTQTLPVTAERRLAQGPERWAWCD